MQPIKIRGIVVRSTDVGDYNKMLTVLSGEKGRISIWAKGVKSPKSKMAAACSLLCYSEFVVTARGDNFTLSQATVIESFYHLREDIEKLSCAVYFAELAVSVCQEECGAEDVIRLPSMRRLPGFSILTLNMRLFAFLLATSFKSPNFLPLLTIFLSNASESGSITKESFPVETIYLFCCFLITLPITSERIFLPPLTVKICFSFAAKGVSNSIKTHLTDLSGQNPVTEIFAETFSGYLSFKYSKRFI